VCARASIRLACFAGTCQILVVNNVCNSRNFYSKFVAFR